MAAERPRRRRGLRPARPLYGYRDIGAAAGARDSKRALVRSWLLLVLMIVIYTAVMLTIYFVEPGLR
jgi:hypothetical protein